MHGAAKPASDPRAGEQAIKASDRQLHKKSLALVNFKGGAGKSTIVANLAATAARQFNWRVLILDLDASAPLTRLALDGQRGLPTVKDALGAMGRGEELVPYLQRADAMSSWLLPGSILEPSAEEIRNIPYLLHAALNAYFEGRHIDLVLIDPPGESKTINGAILSSVDAVALPLALSSTDLAATKVTLQFIKHMQKERDGLPTFLGLIPNRVVRKGTYERIFLDTVLKSGKVLPYLPESNVIKGSFVRESSSGGRMPIHFAPKSAAAGQYIALLEALNAQNKDREAYTGALREYLGLEEEVAKEEVAAEA